MENRPIHTFTWLKVFVAAFVSELAILWIMALVDQGNTELSVLLIGITLGSSVSGLLIGSLINMVSKFKKAVIGYIAGHIVSLLLSIGGIFIYFNEQGQTTHFPEVVAFEDTTMIISGNDKHAIEEVIFLMEQQYPLGAYQLYDIITEYKGPDSSIIYCTIVFTLEDEGNKKYISQYIVKNDSVKSVYTNLDTTSGEYQAYKHKSTR